MSKTKKCEECDGLGYVDETKSIVDYVNGGYQDEVLKARCATMNNTDTIIASIKRKAFIIKDDLKRPPTRLTQAQRAEEIISLCELLEKALGADK